MNAFQSKDLLNSSLTLTFFSTLINIHLIQIKENFFLIPQVISCTP